MTAVTKTDLVRGATQRIAQRSPVDSGQRLVVGGW
jgi:hypothetical protein